MWERNPAWMVGLHLYLGMALALQGLWALLILPLLFVGRWRWSALIASILLMALAVGYTKARFDLPVQGQEHVGQGHFHIQRISLSSGRFSSRWLLFGVLRSFESEGHCYRNVPCRVALPAKDGPLSADQDYLISGTLRENGSFSVISRIPLPEYRSSAERRWHWKERVRDWIFPRFKDREVGNLCVGLVTGEFADGELFSGFRLLGLDHLMAISGFHFSLVALLFSSLFRPWMAPRRRAGLLFFLLSVYFLFLGPGPSVMRAWIMASVGLGSCLVGRPASALNSLGVALIASLLINPLWVGSIGFQYSYGCTAAILLFAGPLDRFLRPYLGGYTAKEVKQMPLADQVAFLGVTFCRRAFALLIAVNLVAMPLALYHFGRFPLLALVYNLFFPLLISAALFLLLLGLLIPVGGLFCLAEGVMKGAVGLTQHLPQALTVEIQCPPFCAGWLVLFWTALLAILLKQSASTVMLASNEQTRFGLFSGTRSRSYRRGLSQSRRAP
jgi:competence protein ComEC